MSERFRCATVSFGVNDSMIYPFIDPNHSLTDSAEIRTTRRELLGDSGRLGQVRGDR